MIECRSTDRMSIDWSNSKFWEKLNEFSSAGEYISEIHKCAFGKYSESFDQAKGKDFFLPDWSIEWFERLFITLNIYICDVEKFIRYLKKIHSNECFLISFHSVKEEIIFVLILLRCIANKIILWDEFARMIYIQADENLYKYVYKKLRLFVKRKFINL